MESIETTSVVDCIAEIIRQSENIDDVKLECLLFRLNTFSLVLFDAPAFSEGIIAVKKNFVIQDFCRPNANFKPKICQRLKQLIAKLCSRYRDKDGDDLKKFIILSPAVMETKPLAIIPLSVLKEEGLRWNLDPYR